MSMFSRMSRITYILLCLALIGSNRSMLCNGEQTSFDCPMRQLALEFALEINPTLTPNQLQQIADALNGGPLANNCNVSLSRSPSLYLKNGNEKYKDKDDEHTTHTHTHTHQRHREPSNNHNNCNNIPNIFVSSHSGRGLNAHPQRQRQRQRQSDGSIEHPFHTIHEAIEYSRIKFAKNEWKQITIREGTYHLSKTIELRSELDSHLVITNYATETVNISGAIPIVDNDSNVCDWKLYQQMSKGLGIYSCVVNNTNITMNANGNEILGLRRNGFRGIRARYPNANPELQGFGSNLTATEWIPRTESLFPDVLYMPLLYPNRNYSNPSNGEHYRIGIGGQCSHFVPPASIFCALNGYQYPFAMVYNQSVLPHTPYTSNISGAVLQVWHPSHWASWMFALPQSGYFPSNSTFILGEGGFQGARGGKQGGEFYIENVFEELDYPTEWYYDRSAHVLYYYTNHSGSPAMNNDTFAATHLKALLTLQGTHANPITNIVIEGLRFVDTAYTYMDAHAVPSGGDWAQSYSGAITIMGAQNITLQHNVFSRLDGNAVFLFDYNRHIDIEHNVFEWLGESGVVLFGNTANVKFPIDAQNPTYMNRVQTQGSNGLLGNQPRFVNFRYNFGHDVGIFEKQSSLYFQTIACLNDISFNVFFNGPRAAVLINDGFGGNNTVFKNLLFNTCRESSDHGPFNSWDRLPYVTRVADGITASVVPGYNRVSYNFMISNYGANYQVDTDGGSSWYLVHHNFLVYGDIAMKSNIGGHNNHHWQNIYAYINQYCINFFNTDPFDGYAINEFVNNTCVLNVTVDVDAFFNYATFYNCSQYGVFAANNSICIDNGNYDNIGWCNVTEKQLQADGNDVGTSVSGWPTDQYLLHLAYQMLF